MAPSAKFPAAIAALGCLSALLAGCQASIATFPYDCRTVWHAAAGEAIVWKPTSIDEKNRRVECVRTSLTGVVTKYELKVARDPFATPAQTSSRVTVSMRQTKPTRVRFSKLEKEFLAGLRNRLQATQPSP